MEHKRHKSSEWISATALKNWFMDDPILDYFKYNSKYSKDCDKDPYMTFIFDRGNKFEDYIIECIREKIGPKNVVDLKGNVDLSLPNEAFNETKFVIENKIPVIHNAVLKNYENKTHGIADIIIRGDYLFKLFGVDVENKDIYYIIDIKYLTLQLLVDGKSVGNSGLLKAYKAQVFIYTDILNQIQNTNIDVAFLLGKGYSFKDTKINAPFGSLGYVNFKKDGLKEKVDKCIEWINKIRYEAKFSEVGDLPELYPNMCNGYDYPYHALKIEIADEIDEITKVCGCSKKHRDFAHSQGIYSWRKCTAEKLGIKGAYTAKIVDAIISTNLNSNLKEGEFNKHLELLHDDRTFYVDFETIGEYLFEEFETLKRESPFLAMIGVGWIENNEWKYKSFIAKDMTSNEELRVCNEFAEFTQNATIYHWGDYEQYIFNKKEITIEHEPTSWINICALMKQNAIALKGAFDYSIKSIGKILAKTRPNVQGWLNDEDGKIASVNLYKSYLTNNKEILKEVEKYNEIDCKMLYEIIRPVL